MSDKVAVEEQWLLYFETVTDLGHPDFGQSRFEQARRNQRDARYLSAYDPRLPEEVRKAAANVQQVHQGPGWRGSQESEVGRFDVKGQPEWVHVRTDVVLATVAVSRWPWEV